MHALSNGCLAGTGSQRAASAVQIKMGHTYLQNVIRLKFPQLRSQEAALVAEAAAREVTCPDRLRIISVMDLSASPAERKTYLQERSKLLNAERYAAVKETYAATLSEIGATLDEMVRSSCQPLRVERVI